MPSADPACRWLFQLQIEYIFHGYGQGPQVDKDYLTDKLDDGRRIFSRHKLPLDRDRENARTPLQAQSSFDFPLIICWTACSAEQLEQSGVTTIRMKTPSSHTIKAPADPTPSQLEGQSRGSGHKA